MAKAKKPRALGNDPFRRGAAVREPVGAEAAQPVAAPEAGEAAAHVEAEPPAEAAAHAEAELATEAVVPEPAQPASRPRRRRPSPPAGRKVAVVPEPPPARHEEEPIAGDAGLLPSDLAAGRGPAVVAVPVVPPSPPHAPPAPIEQQREPHRPADAANAALVALRQLLGLPGTAPSFDVDELGYDPNFEEQVRPLLDWVYDRWFRVELHGGDRLPQSGPVILVANRAGAIPWDSAMLALACRRLGREVRPLVEDDVFHFPALGVVINRLGAVRACPENAERILGQGGAIAVFPEGATGFGKPFRERYRLQRFGRGGFAKLALRTGARIVPVSIVGSEEIHPLLGRVPGRNLGLPFLPVTPTFPWLGLAGLVPLPAKWHIDIGDPIDLAGHGADSAKDDPLVLRLSEHVRTTIQAMLDERLASRRSIFGG